ncbi:MAG: DUF3352 domain-containing protein [Leptolyngbyaceae cyanobacterium]
MLQAARLTVLTAIAPVFTLAAPVMAETMDMEVIAISEAAQVLPSNTAYIVMLDMREETWQQLSQYAFFQLLEARGEEALQPPGTLPFLPPQLASYDDGVEPWVGDTVVLAQLPLPTEIPPTTALEDYSVMLAPIAQPEAFDGFLDLVQDLQGRTPTTQTYQDVSILYWQPQPLEELLEDEAAPFEEEPDTSADETDEPINVPVKALPEDELNEVPVPESSTPTEPGLAIAVLPDFVIAAENPAAIRSWMDLRPETVADSLAAQEGFQRTLSHPEFDGALAAGYGNLPEMVKYGLSDLDLPTLPGLPLDDTLSRQELAELTALELEGSSVEVVIYPEPHGIRAQGRGYYAETILQTLEPFLQGASPEVLATVPDASYLVLSGQNLAATWEQAATLLESQTETAAALEQARFLFQIFTGLDLDTEFLGWMDQGFTAFLFPTRQTPAKLFSPELQIGLGVALQTSDRDAAEYAFAQLDEALGSTFVAVETHLMDEQMASGWTVDVDLDGQPESVLGHAWTDEDTLVVTTSIGSLREILNLATRRQLPNSPIFRRATQDFPDPNQGYLYSNLGAVQWLFNSFFPPLDPTGESEVFDTIQALSGTVSFTEEYLQLDGILMLSPAE